MIHVLYHYPCSDGFASAWVIKTKAEEVGEKNIVYLRAKYAQEFNIEKSPILMVDYSVKKNQLEYLLSKGNEIIVVDHHASAERELQHLHHPNLMFIYDINESGATLTWKTYNPDKPVPLALQYVRDRDLWKFELPDSRLITTAMQSYPFDFIVWDDLVNNFDPEKLKLEGLSISRKVNQEIDIILENKYQIEIGGYLVWCCNTPNHQSDVANKLCDEGLFGVAWFRRQDGKYQYSFRSRGEFDVSAIAVQFGGGGHKNAAGCELDFDTHTLLQGES